MVFSSPIFIFYFLPLFLLLHFLLPGRNIVFLLASLLFYAWGEMPYLFLMIGSITMNYFFGLWIGGTRRLSPGLVMGIGVTVNLLVLGVFKYLHFFSAIVSQVAALAGAPIPVLEPLRLPLGISFFTFQAISYLIDVCRKEVPAERNPLNVALYITMFPHLIAGPIVRFRMVADEIRHRELTLNKFAYGARLFIIGFAMKMLIANSVALPVDRIFALPDGQLWWGVAWAGALCYTLQIYFDFGGYSTMAIGLALMAGIHFPQNFNYPYISQSITEFWRRWHITLSSWFRDYLYIPLGGNRVAPWKVYRNLLIVFILCGLWHGASWTFVLWGLWHGIFLVVERLGLKDLLDKSPRLLRHGYTLLAVVFGWVLFRAETLPQAWAFFKAMVGFGHGIPSHYPVALYIQPDTALCFVIGILWSTPLFFKLGGWINRRGHLAATPEGPAISWSESALLLVIFLLGLASMAAGTYNPFIYFRF